MTVSFPERHSRSASSSTARQTAGFIATNTGMLWLTTALASTALWATYRSIQLVILVAVATIAGSLIALLSARFRWPAWMVLATTVVTYLGIGVPLAVPDRAVFDVLPSPQGLVDLLAGTALSWKQLLTITLPVGSYQTLLVPALILVLGTVTGGLCVALRGRVGELATLAPAVLYVAAILFGAESANWPLASSLGLLASLMVWLIWWRWFRRREALRMLAAHTLDAQGRPLETVSDHRFVGFRTLLNAGLIMLVAFAAAVSATLIFPPTGPREVLRTATEQPFDPRNYVSPLGAFRHYEQATTANRTIMTVTGLPPGGRIRIATLDTYDGIVYSVGSAAVTSDSGSFTRVPYEFDQSAVSGSTVTLKVTIGDYSGVWVPTIGQFESIAFSGADGAALRDSFYYNNSSGTAAVLSPLRHGDSYSISAVQPVQPAASLLAGLTPGTAQLHQFGALPDQLTSTLDSWVDSANEPGQQLQAMISALKKNGYISHGVSVHDPPSRSGHSADRITQLLANQRMIGDQEQYAVTAALMARQLGFPARVVFGFAPTETNGSGATPILGSDVSAWIEVDTARYGWVTIDPTPSVREIPQDKPQVPTTIARPQTPVQPPVDDRGSRNSQVPPDSTQDQPALLAPWLIILLAVLRILGWVALAAAIILTPFLVIIGAKVRRRHVRSRLGRPIDRIGGAWDEYENAIIDRGFTPPVAATRTEVAEAMGGMRPLVLAAITDRAIFSPGEPGAAEADNVWRSVTELVAALDENRTRWQRVVAAISLRSLGGLGAKLPLDRRKKTQ